VSFFHVEIEFLLTQDAVARVKKIIHADDEIANCSNNAAFAITAATELFLQYLVEQTQNVVKTEKKPRRNIQYKDVGS
jgi:DNA polymerase epsilon subunit 4